MALHITADDVQRLIRADPGEDPGLYIVTDDDGTEHIAVCPREGTHYGAIISRTELMARTSGHPDTTAITQFLPELQNRTEAIYSGKIADAW
ncbi:hypothetical protein [Streptomyces sp. NBC_00448]|uniref:hypothetical protein n=1 Tax=Streptomyces sp. NBC_00448 TaxID=2903652 RepID=UPI002E1BC264